MCLAKARFSVNKKGIVLLAGIFGHRHCSRMGKVIGRTDNEIVKGKALGNIFDGPYRLVFFRNDLQRDSKTENLGKCPFEKILIVAHSEIFLIIRGSRNNSHIAL